MPPNNTIVARLTADPRDMQRGFTAASRSAEQLGVRLEKLDAQWNAKMDRMAAGPGGGGKGNRAAMGMLELSRGLEDAAVGFDTNGLQGAVRGSMNNLTAFATLIGGPVAGAVAGFAAASLPMLVKGFFDTESAAEKAKKSLEAFGDQLAKHQEAAKAQAAFQGELEDADTVEAINKEIKERERRLKSIEDENAALQQQRDTESRIRNQGIQQGRQGFDAPGTILGKAIGRDLLGNDKSKLEKSFERDKKIHEEQMKLIEERAKAEEQLNELFDKRNILREAEAKQDQANAIGKREEVGEQKRLELEQNERHQKDIQEQIRRLEGQENATGGGRGQLATVATADSQSLLRAQEQAKQAAKASQERQKQIEELRKINRALEAQNRELKNPASVEVNLT